MRQMRGSGGFAAFAENAARLAATARLAVTTLLALTALLAAGCGRSSLIGSGGTDCPPGAHCVPADMAGADGGRDMSLDMRPSDMRGDMRPSDMRGDMRPGDMRLDGGNPE